MLKKYSLLFKKSFYNFNFFNMYYIFIRFRLIVPGDLIAISPLSDNTSIYYGICLSKYNKNYIINSTFKLRNVFNLNIVEKIYSIGCSFNVFFMIRPYTSMFIKKFRYKLLYYKKKLRSLSVFNITEYESRRFKFLNSY